MVMRSIETEAAILHQNHKATRQEKTRVARSSLERNVVFLPGYFVNFTYTFDTGGDDDRYHYDDVDDEIMILRVMMCN